MIRFATATLLATALLAAALIHGGAALAGLALAYITVLTWALDHVAALAAPDLPEAEFPAGDGLALLLGLAHLPLLYGGVAVLASPETPALTRGLLFLALGLYLGQVSNSVAHELIHRPGRGLRRLGTLVFVSLLFGHHVSAHLRVHHVHAATPRDPNSAPLGQSWYRFAPRAWIGSFRAGYRAEQRLRAAGAGGLHPYALYLGGGLASLVLAAGLGGGGGVLALLALGAYAQAQLLLSDYVQHYGLRRRQLAPGRYAPVGPAHSWNAPQGWSAALMVNAPRHSDHHTSPARAYPGLRLDRQTMPVLPYALPVMAVIALIPPLWRRLMDRRARALRPDGPQGAGPGSG
ncbi:alkane 1-monooxygenase [Salipiger marinus]|uniref:alkane 1-monooxygenase n=1 Tax=Salipiger marinus TaxID=555512 RepID=UPI001E2ECB34|nr:alkane 1-monooxygenase [Salipiger manganoxidans]MCD1616549.1 alkane 1-monooxygenase [Salipiger manganoxidans]MEB3418960.1 alkane 1-monooxygenase [Salipiger manganoxidans]